MAAILLETRHWSGADFKRKGAVISFLKPASQSLLVGDIQLSFATPPSVLPLMNAGRLRALAVTSRTASPSIPGRPGMEEAGLKGYDLSFWYGFFVPTGTPPEALRRLHTAANQVLQRSELPHSWTHGSNSEI